MFGLKKLDVWSKSIGFANLVYTVTRLFPSDERFELTSQLRRAATSIPTNIAEGSGRTYPIDNCRFVETAYGSLMEMIPLARLLSGLSSSFAVLRGQSDDVFQELFYFPRPWSP